MKAIVLLLMAVGLAGTSFAEPPAAFEIVVDPKNSVEGNDAEALYDEMNRVELRQALAESCDLKPELGLAINWTVGSGKSGFTIALLPPEGVSAADAEKLLNVIRKYVELRRVGLTKDFIVPRLKSPQPAAGGAPANSPLAMAQSILPGATEKDFQQIDRRIASFPLVSSKDPKDTDLFVLSDKYVSYLMFLPKARESGGARGFWISTIDIEKASDPDLQKAISQSIAEADQSVKETADPSQWKLIYWSLLGGRIKKLYNTRWLSPADLNPKIQFR
jgi:hypothetical protein